MLGPWSLRVFRRQSNLLQDLQRWDVEGCSLHSSGMILGPECVGGRSRELSTEPAIKHPSVEQPQVGREMQHAD